MKTDPIEETDSFKEISSEVEDKLKEILKDINPYRIGYCHMYWKAKKELLYKDYGIDWKSPSEMNPQTRFD